VDWTKRPDKEPLLMNRFPAAGLEGYQKIVVFSDNSDYAMTSVLI